MWKWGSPAEQHSSWLNMSHIWARWIMSFSWASMFQKSITTESPRTTSGIHDSSEADGCFLYSKHGKAWWQSVNRELQHLSRFVLIFLEKGMWMQRWWAAKLEGIFESLNVRFPCEQLPASRQVKHPYNPVGDKQANRCFNLCRITISMLCCCTRLTPFTSLLWGFLLKRHQRWGPGHFSHSSFSGISFWKSPCQHIQSSFECFGASRASWDRANIMGTQSALIRPAQTERSAMFLHRNNNLFVPRGPSPPA